MAGFYVCMCFVSQICEIFGESEERGRESCYEIEKSSQFGYFCGYVFPFSWEQGINEIGNNEDYWIAGGIFKEIDWRKEFPFQLYEEVLPSVVEKLAPQIVYHRSSPYGGEDPNDVTIGDCHQWHGKRSPLCHFSSHLTRV